MWIKTVSLLYCCLCFRHEATVDPTVQVNLHQGTVLLHNKHNEMDQQLMHHFGKQGWEKFIKTITHWSIWQSSTHIQRVLKQSWNTQCLNSHRIRSHNIATQIVLNDMNDDFYPRGLQSLMKTCHSLTFTACCKLTAWLQKWEIYSSWLLLFHDVLAVGSLFEELWNPTFRESEY